MEIEVTEKDIKVAKRLLKNRKTYSFIYHTPTSLAVSKALKVRFIDYGLLLELVNGDRKYLDRAAQMYGAKFHRHVNNGQELDMLPATITVA